MFFIITRTVNNKKELKLAVKDNVDTIIVSKDLEKELKHFIKVMKMSPKKRNAIIAFLLGAGVAVVATVAAAPVTMGISAIAGMAPVVTFAATSGISIITITEIILLCVVIGASTVISLIRMYDVLEEDIEVNCGPLKLKRKIQYKIAKRQNLSCCIK